MYKNLRINLCRIIEILRSHGTFSCILYNLSHIILHYVDTEPTWIGIVIDYTAETTYIPVFRYSAEIEYI